MKVPANIDDLIREGHSDASIAARVGCTRRNITRIRHALGIPNALDRYRLGLEAAPPPKSVTQAPAGRLPLSPEHQAANRERLLAALRDAA